MVREPGGQQQVHEGKASFDHLYDRADPRPLFRALQPLGYRIPEQGARLFAALLGRLQRDDGKGPLTILDVCCSYGTNAALLAHEVSLDDLYDRFTATDLDLSAPEIVAEADHRFFAERRRDRGLRVLGLDTATNAITYALRAGLLEEGFAENLERDEPSPALAAALRGVDLITVTGGVGYLSARSFDRLLAAAGGRRPWVATFPLRTVAYEPIARALAAHGLVTEQWRGRTFHQRAFVSAEEQQFAVRAVQERGLDTEGKEGAGSFHADFYLSRPAAHVAAAPLEPLLRTLPGSSPAKGLG